MLNFPFGTLIHCVTIITFFLFEHIFSSIRLLSKYSRSDNFFVFVPVHSLTILDVTVIHLETSKEIDAKCANIDKSNSKIRGNTKGCEVCRKIGSDWVHLRLCLTCGPCRMLRVFS
jgi:hypothetical protein